MSPGTSGRCLPGVVRTVPRPQEPLLERTFARSARQPYVRLVLSFLILVLAVTLTFEAVAQSPIYRLDSGDRIRVTVFGHDDLSGEYEVGSAGGVSFPLVGEIQVKGKSLREAEELFAEALRPDYLKNPRVAVEVLNYRPFYIIGEVQSPGSYPYVNGMRVVNAIALAGGFSYRADEDDLYITRGDDPTSTRIEANQNTLVYPGDVIEVTERFF